MAGRRREPHSADLRGATVTAELFDLAGRQLGATRRTRLDIARAATARAFTAAWTKGLPDLHLLRLTLTDARGTEVSRNTYWRYRDPASLRDLNRTRQVKLTGGITKVSRSGNATR